MGLALSDPIIAVLSEMENYNEEKALKEVGSIWLSHE